jgi:Protein of unknown function (DUF3455)
VALIHRWMAVIAQVSLTGLLAGCAGSAAVKTTDVPASLQVPSTARLTQQLHGAGVQIYRCRADKDDAARYTWQLKEPAADLTDHARHKIGTHYAGPTWEALDGSRVVGEVAARADSPDPSAIAWLLLTAKSTSGNGIFQNVRYIQRVRTIGGTAPVAGCTAALAETELRVAYSAEYWFYVAKP